MIPDRSFQQLSLPSSLFDEEGDETLNKPLADSNNNRQDQYDMDEEAWDIIEPSAFARNTINPIRRIVDAMQVQPNPDKALLKLHIGDPTVTGVLPTHENVNRAVMDALMSGKYNGYGPAVGFLEVRQALAQFVSTSTSKVSAEDIVLTSGCSHGLEMAIEALAESGANILVPKPGKFCVDSECLDDI